MTAIKTLMYTVIAVLVTASHATADVRLTELDDRIRVEIDGRLFTEWRHKEWLGPYSYPVIGPNGEAITRHYPMKDGVPHEAQDHPHHRSLRFAHSDVNGLNFWYWRPGRDRDGTGRAPRDDGGGRSSVTVSNPRAAQRLHRAESC